ncbi:hypothetical protein [Streptomyces minutiscleroticus]|uniref:hypothetical protein n=1 Tax=Streptomyces minutiscleroticus TaxID=68238 RepID=UPI0033252CC0
MSSARHTRCAIPRRRAWFRLAVSFTALLCALFALNAAGPYAGAEPVPPAAVSTESGAEQPFDTVGTVSRPQGRTGGRHLAPLLPPHPAAGCAPGHPATVPRGPRPVPPPHTVPALRAVRCVVLRC